MFDVRRIASLVGAILVREEPCTPARVVHDSRDAEPGDLFVALPGGRTDGHAFLDQAFARGACGALVTDPTAAPNDAPNLLVVPDVLAALQAWAAAWRDGLSATIVGITGSNGKTTTKALLAHLLTGEREPGAVFASPRNYNTEIGLPLALLAMPRDSTIGVFELGADRPGDIGRLCDLLRPAVGLITSVGPSHLEAFGTIDAVAREKWTLVDRLPADGLAVINADCDELRDRAPGVSIRLRSTGIDGGDVRGRVVRETPYLTLRMDPPGLSLACPLVGRYNATNLLLAVVTALELGTSPAAVVERAAAFHPIAHRLEPIETAFGLLLDDVYNANPASAAAALHALAGCGAPGSRRAFVFGDMLELGPDSDRYHAEIADLAVRLGIDRVIPVGGRATLACRAIASDVVVELPREAIAAHILREAVDGEWIVLVKGSRDLALEDLVVELRSADADGR